MRYMYTYTHIYVHMSYQNEILYPKDYFKFYITIYGINK